jgi:THO complex subunit 4
LKYDKAGRSDGVAFVTYTSIEDANEAIRKYNGANAAGQPITVTLDVEAPRRPASSPVIRGPRVGGGSRGFPRGPRFGGGARMDTGRGGRGGGGGGGGGGVGGGDRNPRQPRRTQEDLDKELDDFMSGPPPAAENGTGGEEMAVD